jgi:hypothetical protein
LTAGRRRIRDKEVTPRKLESDLEVFGQSPLIAQTARPTDKVLSAEKRPGHRHRTRRTSPKHSRRSNEPERKSHLRHRRTNEALKSEMREPVSKPRKELGRRSEGFGRDPKDEYYYYYDDDLEEETEYEEVGTEVAMQNTSPTIPEWNVSRIFAETIELQELPTTALDMEVDELLTKSRYYETKYASFSPSGERTRTSLAEE